MTAVKNENAQGRSIALLLGGFRTCVSSKYEPKTNEDNK